MARQFPSVRKALAATKRRMVTAGVGSLRGSVDFIVDGAHYSGDEIWLEGRMVYWNQDPKTGEEWYSRAICPDTGRQLRYSAPVSECVWPDGLEPVSYSGR